MRFHSFRAEMQQLCDLTYFVALADQFQYFKFTIAESLDGVGLALRPPMCEFCDHLRRHGWAEIGTSAKNFPDRNYHVVERFLFHHITLRTRAKCAQCVERFIVHESTRSGSFGNSARIFFIN